MEAKRIWQALLTDTIWIKIAHPGKKKHSQETSRFISSLPLLIGIGLFFLSFDGSCLAESGFATVQEHALEVRASKAKAPKTSPIICREFLKEVFAERAGSYEATSETHPHIGSMYFVMLPLLKGFKAGKARKPLQYLSDHLNELIQSGIMKNLYLSPVYPQSTLTYDGYPNSGFYWPGRFTGVDPLLGTRTEYIDLVRKAKERGVGVVQDIVLNHVGYVGKTPEEREHYEEYLRSRGVKVPESYGNSVHIAGRWIRMEDPEFFFQRGSIGGEAHDVLEHTLDPEVALNALQQIQESDAFGLRKLNLDNPKVLNQLIADHSWYVRDAKVSKFRIDSGKHIQLNAIRTFVHKMIPVIEEHVVGEEPAFILEWWTANVHRLGFVAKALGPDSKYVYFLDIPLAIRIRNVFLANPETVQDAGKRAGVYKDRSFHNIAELIRQRWESGVGMRSLVPVVIDHDYNFPIYNGSEKSLAQLGVGYAMAYMMSSNAPMVYSVFDNAAFGPKTDSVWTEGVLVGPRKESSRVMDPNSPAFQVVQSLAKTLGQHEVLKGSEHVFVREVSDDHIVLERRSDVTGKKIIARFSRFGADSRQDEPNGKLLWEYTHGPSVKIWEVTYPKP